MSQINTNTIANELGTGGPDFVGMPTVAGDPVVESGSNTDGEWTRWANGTQHVVVETPLAATSLNGRYKTFFPVLFLGDPYACAGAEIQGSSFTRRYNVSSLELFDDSLLAYLGDPTLDYAVTYWVSGRWK